jgi:hypothetical protein
MPRCVCGKGVRLWSSQDERGYCSDECYRPDAEKTATFKYIAHGQYEAVE